MTTFRELFGIFSRGERPERSQSLRGLHEGLLLAQGQIEALEVSSKANSQFAFDMGELTTGLQLQITELGRTNTEMDRTNTETRLAVAEGIERVDRAERRIKNTVKRARGQLKELGYEDPGLEAEAHELQLVDGGRSDEPKLPDVPEGVATVEPAPSSIKGVSRQTLAKAKGYAL